MGATLFELEEDPLNDDLSSASPDERVRLVRLPRRSMVGAAAWSVPVVVAASAAPAFAASVETLVRIAPASATITATQATTTETMTVKLTRGAGAGTPVAGRSIVFTVSPASGSATGWAYFGATSSATTITVVTGADGVASTPLKYSSSEPATGASYTVTAIDSTNSSLVVSWALTYSPTARDLFNNDFDGIGTKLPDNFTVRTAAGTGSAFPGTVVATLPVKNTWADSAGQFRNVASATGLTSSATTTAQGAAVNRAIAVRQSSASGFDPGAAFVVALPSTRTNVTVTFLLQSLDGSTAPRATTWKVDGGLAGATTPILATTTVVSGDLTTGANTFDSVAVTAVFPAGMNNLTNAFIRIVTVGASANSGNRPTTGIDNLVVTTT